MGRVSPVWGKNSLRGGGRGEWKLRTKVSERQLGVFKKHQGDQWVWHEEAKRLSSGSGFCSDGGRIMGELLPLCWKAHR